MTVYDSATGNRIARPHRFTSLKINEGSIVDQAAQEPAVSVLIMKRADQAPGNAPGRARTVKAGAASVTTEGRELDVEAAKNMGQPALTTPEQGHTHLVDLDDRSGFTSWELMPGGELGHSHPYVVSADGDLTVGEVEGHTHALGVVARKDAGDGDPTNPETSMSQPTDPKNVAAEKTADDDRIEKLEAELATAKAVAGMSDEQKAHRETLDAEAAKAFDAAKPEERTAQVEAAKAADRVVYTSKAGEEFRASDDPRLVAMAKREDERAAEVDALKKDRDVAVLKHRAETELAHIPGDVETRVAMLKAIEGIEDEGERTKALEALKANDAGIGAAFERRGTSTPAPAAAGGSALAEIEAEAAKIAEAEGISVPAATAKFVKTEKGRELRARHEQETQPQPQA